MKYLIALLTLIATLSASAQVTFTTNSGNMSLVLYVTNLPAAERELLEKTFLIRSRAVAPTNANGTVNTRFLPAYAYQTNYVQSGTDTNGQPVFSRVVTTNGPLSRQASLTLIADPANFRTRVNFSEIIREWCAAEQRKIGDLRNAQE
jgi:hypothetical protein